MRVNRKVASSLSLITLTVLTVFVALQNCGPAPLKGHVASPSIEPNSRLGITVDLTALRGSPDEPRDNVLFPQSLSLVSADDYAFGMPIIKNLVLKNNDFSWIEWVHEDTSQVVAIGEELFFPSASPESMGRYSIFGYRGSNSFFIGQIQLVPRGNTVLGLTSANAVTVSSRDVDATATTERVLIEVSAPAVDLTSIKILNQQTGQLIENRRGLLVTKQLSESVTIDVTLQDLNGQTLVRTLTLPSKTASPTTLPASSNLAPSPACRTSQLVAHYKLNHLPGTTSITDSSGNNLSGTLLNADTATVWALGKIGNGLIFDGINDAVTLGKPAQLTNMRLLSVCAWSRLDAGHGYDPRMYYKSSDSTGNSGVGLLISTDARVLHFRYPWGPPGGSHDGFWEARSNPITVGRWYHYCATYNASSPANNPAFYIDGAPVAATRLDSNGAPIAPAGEDSGFDAMIGNRPDLQRPFKGFIDDVRIYNAVISASDVQTLYNSGSGCP